MWTRRELLIRSGALALLPPGCARLLRTPEITLNDVHSQLNRTRVREVVRPHTSDELASEIARAGAQDRALAVMGGRHAMGGQQFAEGAVQIDMSDFEPWIELDSEEGVVDVSAGAQWPELIETLLAEQRGVSSPWGIIQKQTGADRLSIGGALAANAHGRGLTKRPIIGDVESFDLIDAKGELRTCSRGRNRELFALAIGGYGLFGVITRVRLRLTPRHKLERVVEVISAERLSERFAERIAEGYEFGDFQYATDPEQLLRRGVFSCYRPVLPDTPIAENRAALSRSNWLELIRLAHLDRDAAFERYASYYLSTSEQIYWSDTHQLSTYLDDYHVALARELGSLARGSEMISEIYVPRGALVAFLEAVRADLLQHEANPIYGTIRLIESDTESALAWAREPWACVIFNLHTSRDPAGLRRTAEHFRRLIDRGRELGGSYFLTYHRWATHDQVLACYPQLPQVLERKRLHDPNERFQSDWYRHYRRMFEPGLA